MSERNVSIALHLARVMVLDPYIKTMYGATLSDDTQIVVIVTEGVPAHFNPHHDRAQWAECVEWAAVNGMEVAVRLGDATAWSTPDPVCDEFEIKHDNTPEGIRAAALEAIALATGFEDTK